MSTYLDQDDIFQLLQTLSQRLEAKGITADIYVVGGAAMALAYDRKRITRDIDAIFEPKELVYREAQSMASEYRLDPDWINDAVKGFAMPNDRDAIMIPLDGTSTVLVASAKHLLAMKVMASRVERDSEDIRLLAAHLKLSTADEVLAVVEEVVPAAMGRQLTASSRFLVEEIMG